MQLFRRLFVAISALILIGGLGAALALPGPQHMLCPGCHGLQKIAPKIYVEASVTESERRKLIAAIEQARTRVVQFFGERRSDALIVACRSRACARLFGSEGAKGVAYGWHAILLAKSSILDVIATHEMVHVELHWRMGLSGWARGTVPAWFDEGLATVVSEDPRFTRDADAGAVQDVMQVHSYLGQWSQHARRVGWRTAYGAASTRVRQIERKIGRAGLQRFVHRLVRDGDLPGLLRHVRQGKSF